MKYSKKEILEIIISSYQFQTEFDPEVVKGIEINYQTTIFEWRDACDLLDEPKKLAKVFYDYFNLTSSLSELELILLMKTKILFRIFVHTFQKMLKNKSLNP